MTAAAEQALRTRRIAIGSSDSALDAVAKIRAASADHPDAILVMLDGAMPQPDHAMLLAAIAPLALELAPATRLALIDAQHGARPTDVEAAASFLAAARSSTGQVVTIR